MMFVRMMLLASAIYSTSVFAAEIGAVSGFYQSQKFKTNGNDAGGKSVIEVGVRYADTIEGPYAWFVEPSLGLRSYDAPDGKKSASDSTSIDIKGGARWYFPEYSQSLTPFVSGAASVKNESEAFPNQNQIVETSGLFYYGSGGLRMNFHKEFFFDIECYFFENGLFATKKTEPIDDSESSTKSEETSTELFADSRGGISSTVFGLGMKF